MTLNYNGDNIIKSPISDNDTSQKNKKTLKKYLTMFDRDVNIKKSIRAASEKTKETKKSFEKKV